jgi:IS30 family transposase
MQKLMTSGNHKNLNLEDRNYIEQCLKEGLRFNETAKLLGRNPKTISREVKSHRTAKTKDHKLRKSKCAYLKTCSITNLCSNKYCRKDIPCAKCKLRTCSQYCDRYVPGTCPKLLKPPYVCNGCKFPRTCGYDKMYYRGKYADDAYHDAMSSPRKGINLTPEELHELDNLVSPLLLKGQSIAHIYATHSDEIKCSKRTLYNYVDSGALTARNIDLPRKVKYKPRKKHRKTVKDNQTYRIGRTYKEFLNYSEQHSDLHIVEMDTVEGIKGGKVILTLLFRQCNFMAMFLLEANTQECVIRVFDALERSLGTECFKRLFPVILTDNGSEFKDPLSIEYNAYGDTRTRVFYCDPHKSWQKARIEKNHEFIRYILSKGKSFDKLNQQDVTLMANHTNSIARASLNERTPFELATLLLDNDFLQSLELHNIPHDEVLLKPELLKK